MKNDTSFDEKQHISCKGTSTRLPNTTNEGTSNNGGMFNKYTPFHTTNVK